MKTLTWSMAILLTSIQALHAQETGDIRIELSKPFYTSRENIRFTITNDTGRDIPRTDSGSYIYFDNLTDDRDTYAGEFSIPEKSGASITWMSYEYVGRYVHPGTCRIRFYRHVRQPNGTRKRKVYDTFFEVAPPAASGTCVFRTTRRNYAPGGEVKFYLLNRSRSPLILNNGAPWEIYLNSDRRFEDPVFSPIATMALVRIPPNGGRRIWSWNQRGHDGALLEADMYRVLLRFSAGATRRFRSAPFIIACNAP